MPKTQEPDRPALPVARGTADAAPADASHLHRTVLRRMRFVMAAICSVALCALMAALYLLGLMPGAVAASGAALILGSVLAFALVFRWRLNLRATDPSLTVPMTMVAVLCVLYVMAGSDIARDTFVSFFGLVLLFGVFRYTTRTLLQHAGLMLLGYGVVIFLHWHGRPAGDGLLVDAARWLTLATVLPLFTIVGGQIMAGRRAAMQRLRDSEERCPPTGTGNRTACCASPRCRPASRPRPASGRRG